MTTAPTSVARGHFTQTGRGSKARLGHTQDLAEVVRSRARRGVASRRFVAGGLGIHAWTAGEGEPVVLVHGFGVSGRYMLPLAQSLARWFSVFVPELPGSGRSQKPPTPLGIGGLAEALAGCLDALELERPAFVANSMGCQVVTELAFRFPDRAGPLTLSARPSIRINGGRATRCSAGYATWPGSRSRCSPTRRRME